MPTTIDSSITTIVKNDMIEKLPNFINMIGSDNYISLCNGLYEFSMNNQK